MYTKIFLVFFLAFCYTANAAEKINLGRQENGNFEGDIILSKRQRNGILAAARWPNGVIPYYYGTSWTREQDDMIQEAMRAIERSTCIRFVKRTNEKDYIRIQNTRSGCNSAVGKAGGEQWVSLMHTNTSSCLYHGTIVHELLHAIGLWHEQSRYDRDYYLTIKIENVKQGYEHNFNKEPQESSSIYNIPYNYYSVMHYSADAFSSNGDYTLLPKDPYYINVVGNANYGHELDFEKVRRIYECQGRYTPAVTTTQAPVYCSDAITYCDQFLSVCKTDETQKRYCRKTCGFCKDGELSCKDKVDYCWQYKKECGKTAWLNDYCEFTCGLC
jgi:hypothetical protein